MANEKILVVDDDTNICELLRLYLTKEGYQVTTANDGEEGLDKFNQVKPDMVLLDVMMPKMDGLEVCRRIRKLGNTPVMMLTAKGETTDKVNGLKQGADDYITKPFSAAYLKARIFNLLEQRKKLQALYCASLLPASTEQPLAGKKETTTPALSPNDRKFMDKVMEVIDEELSNSEFSINDFCRMLGMSRTSVYNKIKTLTGQGPNDFIRIVRLNKAKELLASRRFSIGEVSSMVGFSDSKYFSTCFKKQFGTSPSKI